MNATETTLVRFADRNDSNPFTYLWICGIGCPAGQDFHHDTETECEEDYCDFAELDEIQQFADLEGTIDSEGQWCWNGEGNVTDFRGNTIYNIKAS